MSALFSAAVAIMLSLSSSIRMNRHVQMPLHRNERTPTTLREWMQKEECFNIALAPQFNNQHSIFAIMQSFKDEGLLKHLSGIAACSGGTLPAVFMAADKDFPDFQQAFPKEGWRGFGPSEPKITKDFHQFIERADLPERIEDLKIPTAISLSMWGTDKAMWEPTPNLTALVVNRGNTRDTLIAALATGSEGGLPDPDCPKCKTGFWPKKLGNASTITDGAFSDLMGVEGLIGLPKCDRVLHILPLDYPGQIGALPRSEIPGQPKDIVTLFFTQPPVASHGYFMEEICNMTIPFTSIPLLCNSIGNWATGGLMISFKPTERSGGNWNQMMFEFVNKASRDSLDLPFDGESELGHKLITLGTQDLFKAIETKNERAYNLMAEEKRDKYWSNFLGMLAGQKSEVADAANAASSKANKEFSKALASVKKIETTYEMPHISLNTALNYPAA